MTHGKTYNKSPRRINHKATKSKTNTGTTALERSVEQTTGRGGGGVVFKALLQLANFTLGPDTTLNTEIHKNSVRIKAPNSVNASKRKHKNQINHYNKQEAHGPRVAHLSDIATADMQMLCNIFPILSSQLMKRSSFKQFFILKKKIYGMPVN